MTQQYINLNQSNVYHLPANTSRAPQVGDVLTFTGKVKVIESDDRRSELLVFTDQISGDEVTMSASALLHAYGTIRFFFKNFDLFGEAMDRANAVKVLFRVNNVEFREMETPGGVIRFKTFTINCEN